MTTSVRIEKVAYRGWPNCFRLTNGNVDLVVTSDVGPRIMRYGFVNGPNLFYEVPAQLGNTAEPWWMMRGGHRLWIAPETIPETYALDNAPVEVDIPAENNIRLLAPIEEETKLRKEMTVTLEERGGVHILHKVQNTGRLTVQIAIWPATVLTPGGTAFAAFPRSAPKLGPTHPLVMWAYTDFSDPRWQFTPGYLVLRQDPHAETQQKTGLFNEAVFAGYLLGDTLFVKRADAFPGLSYPDFHCSFQMFTNRDFMELETLGPLTNLHAGECITHVESWSLHRGIHVERWNDQTLDGLRALVS